MMMQNEQKAKERENADGARGEQWEQFQHKQTFFEEEHEKVQRMKPFIKQIVQDIMTQVQGGTYKN